MSETRADYDASDEVIPIHQRASITPHQLAALKRELASMKEENAYVDMYHAACRQIERLTFEKDGAYNERNKVVAALSKLFHASMERHTGEDWGEDWQWVCIIDLPVGQVSWHVHSSELPLFSHLPYENGRVWDGHTTEEKYERLAKLASKQAATFASTFAAMIATVKAVNEGNGWWDDGERNKAELLMLAVCELAEAVEALRHGNPPSEHLPQYSGEAEELADAIIRLMDYSSRYVPDLGEVISAKVEYNKGRGYKHGKQF